MNKRRVFILFVIVAVVAVGVVFLVARGVGGGAEESGAPVPSPTSASTPTITSSAATPTAPPALTTQPVTPTSATSTVMPEAVVEIRVLKNPYRFEPSRIEMRVGKTYLLRFMGSDEVDTFFLDELNIGITIPANQTVELLFAAGNEPRVYYFYSDIHKNGGNIFVGN